MTTESEEEPLGRIMIEVPNFDGFGEQSNYDSECNSQAEQELEYRTEQEKEEQPQHLRLTRDQISDALYDCIDWWKDEAKEMWAKAWGESWAEAVEQATGIELDAKAKGGQRDAHVEISGEAMRAFWVMSMLDRHQQFTLETGRAAPETWEDLDNEDAGLLIKAVLVKRSLADDVDTATKEGIWYDSDLGCHVWETILDWEKFKAKLDETRQGILEEWEALQPDPPARPAPRCPETLDLFQMAA